MSQKSILSFFKSQPTSATETKSKCVVVEDSSSKKSKNKRKVKCIESDDESSAVPNKKKLNGECSKAADKKEESPGDVKEESLSKSSKKEENEIKRNGIVSPKEPTRKKKTENEKERNSSQSSTENDKMDTDQDKESKKVVAADMQPRHAEKPSSSHENGVELIPKRKTARKQMNSSRSVKVNDIKQAKADDKEVTSKDTAETKHIECEKEATKAQLTSEEPKTSEKSDKNKKSPKSVKKADPKHKINTVNKEEGSPLKKSAKKESIHSFFTPRNDMDKSSCKVDNKKSLEVEHDDSPIKKVQRKKIQCLESDDEDSESTAIEKEREDSDVSNSERSPQKSETAKKSDCNDSEEEISESQISSEKVENDDVDQEKEESEINDKAVKIKDIPESKETDKFESNECETQTPSVSKKPKTNEKVVKNKKSPKTTKISQAKQKINAAIKEEESPSMKSVKKDSIHSFFAPRKIADDKSSSKDDKESPEGENDESPVKKIQRKTKHCLESDDEDNESTKKDKKDSNSEQSPQKSQDSEKSDNKTLSRKKSGSEDSKAEKETQKFSVKSTSAVDTVYDPSKSNYHPIDDAFWKKGEKVPYLALAKTLELIENTSGRLKTIEILSNFFRSVIVLSPDDFLHSVYLCLNRVAPEYEGIEMGVGETLLMKAVAQATGRTVEKIKAEVAIKGDLGLVSESSRGNQRVMFAPPKLTVSAVFNRFLDIAKMSGNSAMAKKTDKIKGLFVACRDCEAKYIIRSLSGKLRIGLAEQSILSAIARAAVLTPPDQDYPPKKIDTSKKKSPNSFKEFLDAQILILKTAYCECPNYDLIIPVLMKEGISALPDRCQLSPGVPLKPMLAHPTAGVDMVLARFDKNAFTCEFKYDGERAQIHMNEKGEVKIFSRNQEDNTSKYPDIISRIQESVKESTKSFILDSEAVAYDRETKQILPFQVLSTRKRKDALESEIVVQVCVMAFDLLYLNGESLVKKPLKERRSLLHSSFSEVESKFMFAQYRDGDTAETMQEFLDESVKGNCEGLMVKALEVDATYEIAKRSHNWLKLKKDYLQGIGDTLDLVVIGGYYGKGKRTGNYGGFLLACYDDENEEFQSICKLGTGFKDDNLEAHTKFFKQRVIKEPKPYYRFDHSLEPDDWFEAVQVWEIKCADLSISPVHKAAIGIVDPKKGISLRFPRFIRIREDKSVEDATNSAQIADMYQKQEQIQNTSNKNANVEEDYY